MSHSCGSRTSTRSSVVAAAAPLVELRDGDGRDAVGLLLVAADPAELLVVDERLDLARAARRAARVLAQLHGPELHRERVHEQEPADERLADAAR